MLRHTIAQEVPCIKVPVLCSDVEERAPSAPAFQPYAYDTHTASTSVLLHEGEDESSHNDTVSLGSIIQLSHLCCCSI